MAGTQRSLRRSEEGISFIELMFALMIGAALLAGMGSFLVRSVDTGAFTQAHVATVDDVRDAMKRIEKDLRSSDAVEWCAPAGKCLQVAAQTPTGGYRSIRYTHSATELTREVYSQATNGWSTPEPVMQRIENNGSQPVFACDAQSTFTKVTIDIHVKNTQDSTGDLNARTSVTPRNAGTLTSCP